MLNKIILAALLTCGLAAAQDCYFPFTFTATGQAPVTPWNNKTTGCVNWQVFYFSTGFSVVSLQFESAPDGGSFPGSFVVFAGSIVGTGTNPMTATTQAAVAFNGGAASTIYPWVRVNLTTATGTGTITGAVFGSRISSPTSFPSFAGATGTCGQHPTIVGCTPFSGTTFTKADSNTSSSLTALPNGSSYFHVLGSNTTGDTIFNYLRELTYPAGCPPCSFTWTYGTFLSNEGEFYGPYFRDSTGKHATMFWYNSDSTADSYFAQLEHNADPLTSNTNVFVFGKPIKSGFDPISVRMIDDGTNIFLCSSPDGGQTFFKFQNNGSRLTELRNSNVATIDRLGFMVTLANGNAGADIIFFSFVQNLAWVADARGC